MCKPLFPPRRPQRKYELTSTPFPSEIIQARVLAYLSINGPCCLHDFGRCDGLARVPVEELSDSIAILVSLKHVTMWYDRVLIRNDEGRPSIGRIPRFALAAPEEGGDS